MTRVVTGEAVALDLRIAQLPSRVVAALLDFAVMSAGALVLFLVTGGVLNDGDDALVTAITIVIVILLFLGYPLAFETLSRGRTLGKMAMGLRVVRQDGGPITFRHALVRSVTALTLERPGLLLIGLGPALAMFVMLFSKDGKRIGDFLAGTLVLQERTSTRPVFVPVVPPPLLAWTPNLDLTALDDALALAVREYLSRLWELKDAARYWLGRQLAGEVAARVTPPPPPDTPEWAFLSAVLAERRRRAELRNPSPKNPSFVPVSYATADSPYLHSWQ